MKTRLITPVLVSVCVLFMFLLDRFLPVKVIIPYPCNLAGGLFLISGLGITLMGVIIIEQAATTLHTYKQPNKLITDGPYRYSRNPIYLGLLLVLIGLWILLGSLSPSTCIAAYFIVSNNCYIPFEERMLAGRFGPAYSSYQNRVRRWI